MQKESYFSFHKSRLQMPLQNQAVSAVQDYMKILLTPIYKSPNSFVPWAGIFIEIFPSETCISSPLHTSRI